MELKKELSETLPDTVENIPIILINQLLDKEFINFHKRKSNVRLYGNSQ